MLITAPTSHRVGGEPAYLQKRWISDLSMLVPLHASYNEVVRIVAATEKACVCDVAAEFEKINSSDVSSKYFSFDGIHMLADGNQHTAEILADCLRTATFLRHFVN